MIKFRSLVGETHMVPVVLRGKQILVGFSGGKYNNLRLGEFCTSDPELAEVLRNGEGYGRYWVEVEDGAAGTPAAVPPPPLQGKVCRTLNEAREWLAGMGCPKEGLNTTAKAVSAAQARGYRLEFRRNG